MEKLILNPTTDTTVVTVLVPRPSPPRVADTQDAADLNVALQVLDQIAPGDTNEEPNGSESGSNPGSEGEAVIRPPSSSNSLPDYCVQCERPIRPKK